MKQTVIKFLLAGDKFMLLLGVFADHLLKTKKEQQNPKKQDIILYLQKYIYQNKLGKACCQHHLAYVDFKNLPRYSF